MYTSRELLAWNALIAAVAERQTPQADETVEGRKGALVADGTVIQNQCLHGCHCTQVPMHAKPAGIAI